MNREFKPTSKLMHAALAAGSLIVSIVILGSTASLASYYSAEPNVEYAQRVVVARR